MSNVADMAGACPVPVPVLNCPTEIALPWFAVRVREKFRTIAETMLHGKEVEYFSPVTTEIRMWSDRRKAVDVPLFPGYLFCRFDPQYSLPVLQVLGVIDIVRVGNHFAEVNPVELEAVRRALQSDRPVEALPHLVSGQRVRVIDGPLRDLEGVLLEYRSQVRLVLAVTMMNRAVSIEISRTQVEAIA